MVEKAQPVVQTVGLCKTFRDFWHRPRVQAVQDLNLEIQPGEVFGLLGPNGSGKTTTIKMLLGLLYPTRGRISVFGKPPSDVSVKARIGFLPEESYLYPFLVGHETLDFYGRLFQLPARVRRERTERLLDMVGLRHEAKRRIGEYSKGMARRIGLAQALINDPEFLILDEPTSGLDPIGARQIKDVIRTLGRKGKTILLSSHILADVEDVCDRVMILYGGQERAAGDINELLRRGDATQITAPALSEATIRKVRDLIRRSENKELLDVSNPRVKLEDFFLRIVEEAQAANIVTSGARLGGGVPEFLKKAADVTTSDVVSSLVGAAERETQQSVIESPSESVLEPEPVDEVVEELLSAGSPTEDGPCALDVAASTQPERNAGSASTSADARVIDELLGRGDDDVGPASEKRT